MSSLYLLYISTGQTVKSYQYQGKTRKHNFMLNFPYPSTQVVPPPNHIIYSLAAAESDARSAVLCRISRFLSSRYWYISGRFPVMYLFARFNKQMSLQYLREPWEEIFDSYHNCSSTKAQTMIFHRFMMTMMISSS